MKTANMTEFDMAEILINAINTPGKLMEAYSAFHNYSLNNVMLAWMQCDQKELPIGPINTFKGWQALGRQVQKGQKAIALLMPVTLKKEDKNGKEQSFTKFITRNNWFVLSQTEGDEYKPETLELNGYDREAALNHFGVTETAFNYGNGNAQGFATADGELAINPLAQLPHKTFFHELTHNAFHFKSDCDLTKEQKEVEAESVALLCLEALGLEGTEYCRGYIQNWLNGNEFTDNDAKRIIKRANIILKAGNVVPEKE